MLKSALTVNELSREIGVGRTKIYDLIKEGKLFPRKIGTKTVFLAEEVQDFLNNLPKAA